MRELAELVTQGAAERSHELGDGTIHIGLRRLVIAAGWLCKWFLCQEESLASPADTLPITR